MPIPAQQQQRSDEIVDEILAVLDPPAHERDAIRAKVIRHIDWLRKFAHAELSQPPGKLKQQLADSLDALRKAKWTLVRWPNPLRGEVEQRQQTVEALNREIKQVEYRLKLVRTFGDVRRTGNRSNLIKKVAVEEAADYLPSEQWKLTDTGAWHRLSQLFYEGATGEACDLMHVLTQGSSQDEALKTPAAILVTAAYRSQKLVVSQ